MTSARHVEWYISVRRACDLHAQLMNPTLAALHALGGSTAIPELVERVIADLRCPRELVEQPHGDRGLTELEY